MLRIYNFLLKYKFLHILFWIVKTGNLYHDLSVSWKGLPKVVILFNTLNEIGFEILCVYTTIYFLIPKYFYKKRFLTYNGLALTLYITSAFAMEFISDMFAKHYYSDILNPKFNWIIVVGNFLDILTYCVIFSILVMVDYYYTRDKKNKAKETERLVSELNFLKAQLNPHFLLNAINNIYVLMEEDKNKSRDYLIKFSELLRYQLYECSKESHSLQEELYFIKNYIEFEKIRLDENIKVEVILPNLIDENTKIAPLLLIPFIENCFKHVSHNKKEDNSISIEINFFDNKLILVTKNTYIENFNNNKQGGVGLTNVQRRLELLYPEKHKIEIEKLKDYYITKLRLNLKDEIEMHHN